MEKSKKTKIIKLVSATSMVIFSLFVSISGAFAWFASVRNVNTDGTNFYVQSVGTAVKAITLHEFYGENDSDLSPVTTNVVLASSTEIPTYNLPANTRYIHITTTATAANSLVFTVNSGEENETSCPLNAVVDINSRSINAGATDFIIDVCYSALISEEDLGNAHTLNVSYTNAGSNFSITIARYEKPCFTFNPTGVSIFNNETGTFDTSRAVSLNPYFVEKPHHPVLIMYKIDGVRTRIDLETDYCFLSNKTNYIVAKYRTYAALLAAKNASQLVASKYYEVINDENYDNVKKPATLYRMDEDLSCVTYANFSDIDVNTIKANANANDGRYYRVQTDENHGNVSSIYQFHKTTKDFEVVWLDLGNSDESKTNPLSSVVDFYSIEFEESAIEDMVTYKYVAQESFNTTTQDYDYAAKQNIQCLAVKEEDLNGNNISSFTNFSDPETYDYEKSICIYDNETSDYTYVGIVVDYDQLALEYIFSNNIGHDALNAGLMFVCDWVTKF